MKTVSNIALALTLACALPLAFGGDEHSMSDHMNHMHMAEASQTVRTQNGAASMSEGEVKKIDKSAGKLTIKHGPIKNLDMPAMTMVFHVKDPAMLAQVKAGDKISFSADNIEGQLTLTQVQVKK